MPSQQLYFVFFFLSFFLPSCLPACLHHIQTWTQSYNPNEVEEENQVFMVSVSSIRPISRKQTDKKNKNKKIKNHIRGGAREGNKPQGLASTYQPERFDNGRFHL